MKNKLSFFRIAVVIPVVGLMALSCLNPIGFSPDLKLKLDVNATVSGEVGIDSVNSAEIQLRNHTQSIDIYKTEIVFIDNGATPPVNGTAARITGAPASGTQESILLRPIGPDVNTRYVIHIWYRQSASCPDALKQTAHPGWDFGGKSPDKTFEITELPRGKYVIHVYRTDAGEIGIVAEDDTAHITEMRDHSSNQDHVVDVKVNNVIDLSGASIALTVPSGGLNVNTNTNVSFSSEVTALFNALIDAMNNNRPYPNGYGALVVRNHTTKQLSNVQFDPKDGQSAHTVGFPGVIRAEDQERFILKQGKWEAKFSVDGKLIGPKNVFITNQGKEFLTWARIPRTGKKFLTRVLPVRTRLISLPGFC